MLVERYARHSDIICCTETWFTSNEADTYQIDDFSHYSICRKAPYGGVSVFVKKTITVLEWRPVQTAEETVQLVALRLRDDKLLYWIVCGYSSSVALAETFTSVFCSLLHGINPPILLVGDLNVDLLACNPIARRFRTAMQDLSMRELHCGIKRPESITCLDHIWLSLDSSLNVGEVEVLEHLEFSDHYPISILLRHRGTEVAPARAELLKRNFSGANYDRFFDRLARVNWSELYCSLDVDRALEIFDSKLFSVFDYSFPLRPTRVRKIHRSWFTPFLAHKRRRLHQIGHRFFKCGQLSAKHNFYESLKSYRTLVRAERKRFTGRLYGETGGDPGKIWRLLNSSCGRDRGAGSQGHPPISGTDLTNFADYFASIGKLTADRCPHPADSSSLAGSPSGAQVHSLFSLRYIDPDSLVEAGMGIKSSYSRADVEVPSKVLLNALSFLRIPIAFIFNLSIRLAIYPSDPSNYGPISLAPLLSKIFEKAILTQLRTHLMSHDIISIHQHGFVPSRSTETALLEIHQYIVAAWNQGKLVLAVFLDLSEAFDCLEHSTLLSILSVLGLDEGSIDWFSSYLRERVITVSSGELSSPPRRVNQGVPQGSVLGPLLFVLYLNPLLTRINSLS